MEKENPEKPVLPPTSGEATKRMWDTTGTPQAAPARSAAVDVGEVPEVKCDYCGSMVRIRRGGRCPICNL